MFAAKRLQCCIPDISKITVHVVYVAQIGHCAFNQEQRP